VRETKFWTWQVAAAVVILVVLGLHMAIMHLDGTLAMIDPAWADPLAWGNVLARAKSALFTAGYVLLLAATLYHGLYGLRTMICELTPSPRARRWTAIAFWSGGAALFALGSYALIAMHVAAGTPA
jgi:succinate dehydrogenase / fumarate reductase membrane anchor subunit